MIEGMPGVGGYIPMAIIKSRKFRLKALALI